MPIFNHFIKTIMSATLLSIVGVLPLLFKHLPAIANVENNRDLEADQLFQKRSQIENNRDLEADQLFKKGQSYREKEDYKNSLTEYTNALRLYKSIENLDKEGIVLNSIGAIYINLDEDIKALEYFENAKLVFKKAENKVGISASMNNIGFIYSKKGDYLKSLDLFQRSLRILRIYQGSNSASTIRNPNNELIEYVYGGLGKYIGILNFKLSPDSGPLNQTRSYASSGYGAILSNIGSLYNITGKYSEALSWHERSLGEFNKLENLIGQGESLNNIGLAYYNLGEYKKSLEFYENSLDIFSRIKYFNGVGEVTNNIASIYTLKKDYPEALRLYQEAIRQFEQAKNSDGLSISLNNIGIIYSAREQHQKAFDFYQNALKILDSTNSNLVKGIVLNNIAYFYASTGRSEEAFDFYQKSLQIFNKIGYPVGQASTLSNIGYLLEFRKEPILAIIFLKQSVITYEKIRGEIKDLPQEQQRSYTKTVAGTYRHLADLLLQQNRVLEAQQILDLLKVQELDDYLQNVRGTAQPIEFRRAEQKIIAKYNEIQTPIFQISSELANLREIDSKNTLSEIQKTRLSKLVKLETEINTEFTTFINSPEIKQLVTKLQEKSSNEAVNLAEVRKIKDKLKKLNAVLLYPLILDDRLELVLSIPGSPPLRRTVNVKREELNRTIAEFRSALGNRQNNTQELAKKLYGWLIQPIEADLKQANPKTILYAPDGQLRYIPLAALHDGKQWLVERYQINNITALAFSDLVTPPRKDQQILAAAFGNNPVKVAIDNQSFNFDGLPFTTKEVQSLVKTRPGTVSLFDRDFTLSTLQTRMNSFNILHLATHGKFLIGNPKKSFLVMGNGDRFSLSDIQDSTLDNVDLVVLSACETGVGLTGKDEDGVEVLGIGYQFQRGGAKAAISSLWSINDGGTQRFMEIFYGLLQQGMPKAEALQQAQIALIKGDFTAKGKLRGSFIIESIASTAPIETNLKHPFYWAPFILIGNGL